MMDDNRLEETIRKVLADLKQGTPNASVPLFGSNGSNGSGGSGVFSTVDKAVDAAKKAFQIFQTEKLEKRKAIIQSIREQGRLYAQELAKQARDETSFGDYQSKVEKNLLVCNKTPGPEILKPTAFSGDHGLTVLEHAAYGVIGSITPSTNPTATIINNAISILSAGNAVVFNVHPRAKDVSVHTIRLLNQAVAAVGGPRNLIACVEVPTVESAQELMANRDVNLVLVTGGPSVVKVAMQSGKRAICAGPGNPPAVVDESADIGKTAEDLVLGACFDNNLPCTCEKEIFSVSIITDQLKKSMEQFGAKEIHGDDIARLEKVIFSDSGDASGHASMNPKWIGQPAWSIMKEAGLPANQNIRLIILEVQANHPLVKTEQMMPVLPIIRVSSFQEAVDRAFEAEQGFHHSAGIHSLDIRNLSYMAKVMNTSLFIKNGPHYAGLGYQSEGYTSFSIGTFTREGLTTAKTFTWERRCVLVDHFRIV